MPVRFSFTNDNTEYGQQDRGGSMTQLRPHHVAHQATEERYVKLSTNDSGVSLQGIVPNSSAASGGGSTSGLVMAGAAGGAASFLVGSALEGLAKLLVVAVAAFVAYMVFAKGKAQR